MGRGGVATEASLSARGEAASDRLDVSAITDNPLKGQALLDFFARQDISDEEATALTVVGGSVCERHSRYSLLSELNEAAVSDYLAEVREEQANPDDDDNLWLEEYSLDQLAVGAAYLSYRQNARRETLLEEWPQGVSQTEQAYFLMRGTRSVAAFMLSRTAENRCGCESKCRCSELIGSAEHWGVEAIESQDTQPGAAEALARYVAEGELAGQLFVFDAFSEKSAASYQKVWKLKKVGSGHFGYGRFILGKKS